MSSKGRGLFGGMDPFSVGVSDGMAWCFLMCKIFQELVDGLEQNLNGNNIGALKRIVGSDNFSAQFIKIISHYKKIGYNINVLQQTACLVVNPIMVGNFAFLFNCTPVGRTSDSMMVLT